MPLRFDPDGSAFVVFRKHAAGPVGRAPAFGDAPLRSLDSGWTLSFQQHRGGPAESTKADTGSWSDSADPRVRYFSGTGTYARDIEIPAQALRQGRLILDLGEVRELVDVVVNGRPVRTLWKPPYRLDITDALKPGSNRIELRVTNLWVNRLIGDAQPGAEPITVTTLPTYKPGAPLAPSGLIGPVRLVVEIPAVD